MPPMCCSRALVLSGDAAAAVPKLKKASRLQTQPPEPHTLLADGLCQAGTETEAETRACGAESLRGGRRGVTGTSRGLRVPVINFAPVYDAGVSDPLVGMWSCTDGERAGGTAAAPKVVSPNIILITLDTTRADRMDFWDRTRG